MNTYTAICCNTGDYEGPTNPYYNSVRVFILTEPNCFHAGVRAREYLKEAFGDPDAEEWRVIAMVAGEGTVLSESGNTLTTFDKRADAVMEKRC